MKNLYSISLLVVALGLGFSVKAQNDQRIKGQQSSGVTSDAQTTDITSEVKANYVNNQDYLYPATSNQKLKKGFLRDSLMGFDEASRREDLLNRHFTGSEYIVGMNWYKRDYIDRKYKIGPIYGANPAITGVRPGVSPGAGNRPIGGGGNVINLLPCVNEDFELTAPGSYNTGNAVTGWTVESTNNVFPGIACAANLAWNAGSPEFSIVATPILAVPYVSGLFTIDNVTIPNSPLGGTNIARLNDSQSGILATRMISTFPVTAANSLFQFAYAGSWHSDGHACCDQPSFTIRLYNCPGAPLTCSSVSLTPTGPTKWGMSKINFDSPIFILATSRINWAM